MCCTPFACVLPGLSMEPETCFRFGACKNTVHLQRAFLYSLSLLRLSQQFLFFIRFNNSLVKIVVSGGSVVIFCFHADRYAVWMKIWVSSACCTGHKTGSFFVIAEMKLFMIPACKILFSSFLKVNSCLCKECARKARCFVKNNPFRLAAVNEELKCCNFPEPPVHGFR